MSGRAAGGRSGDIQMVSCWIYFKVRVLNLTLLLLMTWMNCLIFPNAIPGGEHTAPPASCHFVLCYNTVGSVVLKRWSTHQQHHLKYERDANPLILPQTFEQKP